MAHHQGIQGGDSGELVQGVDHFQEGYALSAHKEFPTEKQVGPGEDQSAGSQKGTVPVQQFQKARIVLPGAAAPYIVHQIGGEQAVVVGKVRTWDQKTQDLIAVQGAEPGDPQGDGEQD